MGSQKSPKKMIPPNCLHQRPDAVNGKEEKVPNKDDACFT